MTMLKKIPARRMVPCSTVTDLKVDVRIITFGIMDEVVARS